MRKRRKLIQGAKYQVMAWANRREMILEAKQMKEMFLKVAKRAGEEDGIMECWKDGIMEG